MNKDRIVFGFLLAGSIILAPVSYVLAQPETSNPLEVGIDQSDPVIPLGYGRRELSAFEIRRIEQEMAQLNRSAKAELQQGNGKEAFKLRYRQLKLARAVGVAREIETLGKVGAIAWQENRGEDLRNIANRLITIESKIETDELAAETGQKLATAYQQVRYLEQAIAIYEQILAQNEQQKNSNAVAENLQTLGELYLAQFNYSSAANSYEKLLELAQTKPDLDLQTSLYLKTLADIYDRNGQTPQALAAKKRLYNNHEATNKTAQLAELKLAIADDYQALNQTSSAIEAYNQAFKLASENQQLAIASNALTGLAELHQQEGETEQAIVTFEQLLDLQRQAYNYYGLVNTYDTLGKIHLASAQPQQAKQYFQQALAIAKDLNYKVEYFARKIEQSDRDN
ncbi:MAG: tetratricopeptide repeat protein [Cyanobacteria bacterium J06555_3]